VSSRGAIGRRGDLAAAVSGTTRLLRYARNDAGAGGRHVLFLSREPRDANPDHSRKVKRNLQRRHVILTGDWQFWIQYGESRISTRDGVLTSDNPSGSHWTNVSAMLMRRGWFPSKLAPTSGLKHSILIWARPWKYGRHIKFPTSNGASIAGTVTS